MRYNYDVENYGEDRPFDQWLTKCLALMPSSVDDPREANNINIQLAKDAQEVAPDNVVSFSDAKKDQMVSKIKGAIQNMPYTMNLPYEIGQKLNSEGKLPLPIGNELIATRRQRLPR
jgi:hypothetical protein